MRYRWILFDADGTLFDYDKAEATALAGAFAHFGYECKPDYAAAYQRINSQLWLDFERGKISSAALRVQRFARLFEVADISADPEAFSTVYLQHLAACSELIDGALETVQALHGKVGLLLITNGLKEVQRHRFARSAIRDYFAGLVISDEVGAAKPDGRIFDVAFDKMGKPAKADVLIVGDSLTSDIKGGSAYGIDTCWFNPAGEPRDLTGVRVSYEIADLREILQFDGLLLG